MILLYAAAAVSKFKECRAKGKTNATIIKYNAVKELIESNRGEQHLETVERTPHSIKDGTIFYLIQTKNKHHAFFSQLNIVPP